MSWQIWVDTGGTFTDCIAINDSGELSRLKVLSNGTLRGRVLSQLASDTLAVDINWPTFANTLRPAQPGDIYEGYILTDRNQTAIVKSVDTRKGFITLQQPSKYKWTGKTIELTTGEEV